MTVSRLPMMKSKSMSLFAALTSLSLSIFSHSAQAYTFDRDVPENLRNEITRDMAFIGSIQGNSASPLHKEIFGDVNGKKYVEFFESRVTAIGLDDCGGGKPVACVIPYFDPSRIWLTQNYIKFDHPQIAKMMVVFHEARHTETKNNNWHHAECPTPFVDSQGEEIKSIWTGSSLAGEPACDSVSRGSYGSSTIMLKNVSKFCTTCNEKVKADAGIYADDQFKRIIGAGAQAEMKKDLY